MFFKFGAYVHPANEAIPTSFSKQPVRGPRGLVIRSRWTMTIEGVLIYSTQANIKAAVRTLEAAYSATANSAGLYHDDGTASGHTLPSGSLTGVRVQSLTWPQGGNVEYATQRTFKIVLEADYLTGDDLLTFQEQIRIIGDGGPQIAVRPVLNGKPITQQIWPSTPVLAIQSGSAVGVTKRPSIPGPIWPAFEQHSRREYGETSPTLDGLTYVNTGVNWSYFFESPTPLTGKPNRR